MRRLGLTRVAIYGLLMLALIGIVTSIHRGLSPSFQLDRAPKQSSLGENANSDTVQSEGIGIVRKLDASVEHLLADKSLTYNTQLKALQEVLGNPWSWNESWQRTKIALENQGFVWTRSRRTSVGFVADYRIKRDIFVTAAIHWDLYLIVGVEFKEAGISELEQETVRDVSMEMRATVNMSHSEIVREGLMPKGSVLEFALNWPEFALYCKDQPIVKTIAVSYLPVVLHVNSETCNAAFRVDVHLAANKNVRIGDTRLQLEIESGLDPLRLWDGTIMEDIPFQPRDTYGLVIATAIPE